MTQDASESCVFMPKYKKDASLNASFMELMIGIEPMTSSLPKSNTPLSSFICVSPSLRYMQYFQNHLCVMRSPFIQCVATFLTQ